MHPGCSGSCLRQHGGRDDHRCSRCLGAVEALASAGEVADVKAASTFDTENSDPAANIGDLTMTAVAF